MLKYVILSFWLISAIYFGAGGLTSIENKEHFKNIQQINPAEDTTMVEYKGIVFADKEALYEALEGEQMRSIFPWIYRLPSYLTYMVTAGAFGLLGTIVRIFILLSLQNKRIDECNVYTLPVLGMLTGLVMLGVSLIFPAIILTSETEIRPGGLMFICLFSGIYIDSFYEKLSNIFSNIFNSSK